MDESVSGYCGHQTKWVKRINWMDSRKISQVNAANTECCLCLWKACSHRWLEAEKVQWDVRLQYTRAWPGSTSAKQRHQDVTLTPSSFIHPPRLTNLVLAEEPITAHHTALVYLESFSLRQWPWTLNKTFCTLSKYLEHYVQIEVFYMKC